nr:MAG TPA: hypothetical protein [Caudoviricetes sp.]
MLSSCFTYGGSGQRHTLCRCPGEVLGPTHGGETPATKHPQGVRRIRKAAGLPTAAQKEAIL